MLLSRNPLLLVWSWILAEVSMAGTSGQYSVVRTRRRGIPWAVSVTGPKMKLLNIPHTLLEAEFQVVAQITLRRCHHLGSHGCTRCLHVVRQLVRYSV